MPRLNEVWEIIKLIIDKFVEYKKNVNLQGFIALPALLEWILTELFFNYWYSKQKLEISL